MTKWNPENLEDALGRIESLEDDVERLRNQLNEAVSDNSRLMSENSKLNRIIGNQELLLDKFKNNL